MNRATILSMFVGLGLALAPSVHATSIAFNYTASPGVAVVSSVVGNSIIETQSGEVVTATAWDVSKANVGTFQAAALDEYIGTNLGLGICTAAQLAGTCNPPNHEVNDATQFDFVLFTFSQAVSSVTLTLNPVCQCYTDDSFYVGTGSPSGKTLANVGKVTTSDGNPFDVQRVITLSGLNGATSILFGASIAESDNYFKIGAISVTESTTPEPATFGLAGIALIGLGLWRRKSLKSGTR